ncbi:MAG: DNA-binding transcriptional regulator OxyR [Enterovibrio sp.]
MNIRDLEYLVALSEHQHFRKAAEACFVSQPTLSGQIRKLENELGVLLLERSSRKLFFTDAGMQIVRQAQKVLLEIKLLQEIANQQGEVMAGQLNIGVIPTIGPYLLPHVVPLLKEKYPHLAVTVFEAQTNQLVQQLEEGKLDCVIWAAVRETSHLREIALYNEPLLIALPETHRWAKKEHLKISDLKGESLLMLADGHCLRDQALGVCFTAGASEDKRFRATSLETIRSMISANIGLSLFPKLAVPKCRNRDGVVYIPTTQPEAMRQITLGYRPGSPLRKRYKKLAQCIGEMMTPFCEESCAKDQP